MSTGQKNMNMQQELITQLSDNNPFSQKGITYLAKRALGTRYAPILKVAIQAMTEQRLQNMLPTDLKQRLCKAFNYKDTIPDAALIIIATGRRAVHGQHGFNEGGKSLLTDPIIPDNLETLNEKTQEHIITHLKLQLEQKKLSEELMEILLKHVPKAEPIAKTIKEIEKPLTAEVLPFKKKITTSKKTPIITEPTQEPAPEVKKPRTHTKKEVNHE